jgi:hypothetical protein
MLDPDQEAEGPSMPGTLLGDGLALVSLALSPPPAAPGEPPGLQRLDISAAIKSAPARSDPARYRWVAAVRQAAASAEEWGPPAQSWGEPGRGPVIEIGALGSRHRWQPDLMHLSLDWNF